MSTGPGPIMQSVLEALPTKPTRDRSSYREMTTDELAAAVYGDGPTESQRRSMRRALTSMRRRGDVVTWRVWGDNLLRVARPPTQRMQERAERLAAEREAERAAKSLEWDTAQLRRAYEAAVSRLADVVAEADELGIDL